MHETTLILTQQMALPPVGVKEYFFLLQVF